MLIRNSKNVLFLFYYYVYFCTASDSIKIMPSLIFFIFVNFIKTMDFYFLSFSALVVSYLVLNIFLSVCIKLVVLVS